MKHSVQSDVDVYAVGIIGDLRQFALGLKAVSLGLVSWRQARPFRSLRHVVADPARYVRTRKWRELRNYFNGYLAEHHDGNSNAGRGWTKRAARRRLRRIRSRAGL